MGHLEAVSELFGPVTFIGFSTTPNFASLREHQRYLALQAAQKNGKRKKTTRRLCGEA
ncbi:MAG: hypothetical protein ACT4NL_16615 [Pseudomarimonas sp.]